MSTYDDETLAISELIDNALADNVDLIDCFRDDNNTIYIVICIDDVEHMLTYVVDHIDTHTTKANDISELIERQARAIIASYKRHRVIEDRCEYSLYDIMSSQRCDIELARRVQALLHSDDKRYVEF